MANDNGLGGLTIHAHLAGQDFNGNQIINNSFSHDGLHGYPSGAPGDSDAGIHHTVGIIIYSLVTQSLGGRLSMNSAPGKGTVFRIVIPRVASDAAAAATTTDR